MSVPILWQAENEFLAVSIAADAQITIIDKQRKQSWQTGRVALQETAPIDIGHVWLRTQRSICEQYAGRFRGEALNSDTLKFTVLSPLGHEMGQFTCRLRLDQAWFVLSLPQIDEQLNNLSFPPAIESESLVVPSGVGRWIRKPLPDRHFWAYPSHFNMRWFGGLQSENGWLCVYDEGYANIGLSVTQLAAAPAWLKSQGSWQGERTLRYLGCEGGYVGLAKAYRAYAKAHGMFHSLHDKIEDNPALAQLVGGRIFSFMIGDSFNRKRQEDMLEPRSRLINHEQGVNVFATYAQVAKMIEEGRELGMQCGLVIICGWIQGGYDESHPDVWPPEAAFGSPDELKQLLQPGKGLIGVLHDNYQDIYEQSPSWPQGVNRAPQGEPMAGGLWAGGQAYILNARDGLAYAKRNWPPIASLNPSAMFIDTVTAVQFYESYEPNNTLSRAQDLDLKIQLLEFYKEQKQLLGSEEGADFGIPYVDWIEGRHRRVSGESIPLWPLVFHDSVFTVRYTATPFETEAAPGQLWLTEMLWGYPLLWDVRRPEVWQQEQASFKASLRLDHWIEQIGTDEMLSHRYLTEDGDVEETTWSSGLRLIVNFSKTPFALGTEIVQPHDFIIQS
jgi:hypothetical protein